MAPIMSWIRWAAGTLPGVCQVRIGKPAKGIGIFFIFMFLLNAAVVAPFLTDPEWLRWLFFGAAVVLWAVSLVKTLGRKGPATRDVMGEPEKEKVTS